MFCVYSQSDAILSRIREKRQELLELGSRYELTHHEVLQCSQELDVLINLVQGTATKANIKD